MIELPGFEVVVPNVIFMNNLEDPSFREIVLLLKYRELKPDQVYTHLKEALLNRKKSKPDKDSLEQLIEDLPEEVIQALVQNRDFIEPYLVCHTLNHPDDYLLITYGWITVDDIESKKDLDSIKRFFNANDFYCDGVGEKWSLNLKLKDGHLPPFKKVSRLLKWGAPRSNIHLIEPEDGLVAEEVLDITTLVYESLGDPNKIKKVVSHTAELCHSYAEISLRGFVDALNKEIEKHEKKYLLPSTDHKN